MVRAPFSILCALTLAAAGCGRDFPYRIETSERRTDGRVAGTDPADAEISDRLDPIQDVPSPGDGFIPDRDPSMDGDLPDLVIPDAGPMDGFIADRVTFDARPPMPDTGSSDSGLPDGPIIPDVFVPDAFIPDTGITDSGLPPPRAIVRPTRLDLTCGSSGQFTVVLDGPPGPVALVTISAGPANVVTISGPLLVFTDANWSTPQTVTVNALPSTSMFSQATVTVSAPGSSTTIPVQVTCGQMTPRIIVNPSSLTINGGTQQAQVTLSGPPASPIAVNLVSSDASSATVFPAQLIFTPTNFAVPQTINVGDASPRDPDCVVDNVTINLSAVGLMDTTMAVTVRDPDTCEFTATPAAVTLVEGNSTMISVAMTFHPGQTVNVSVASMDPAAARATPSMLSFNPTNFAVLQSVRIEAPQDPDMGDEITSVTLSAPGIPTLTIPVMVLDDDRTGFDAGPPDSGSSSIPLVVAPTSLSFTQAGNRTVSVRLGRAPLTPVTVTVDSDDPIVASVTPSSRTFDSSNWFTFQRFTVRAAADTDCEDDAALLTFNGGLTPVTVSVLVRNVWTTQLVEPLVTRANILEGDTRTVPVQLRCAPSQDVQVSLQSTNPAALVFVDPTITIAREAYNEVSGIPIEALQDSNSSSETGLLRFTPSIGTTRSLGFTVRDDDGAVRIVPNPRFVGVEEGATAGFDVRLSSAPANDTVVTISTPSTQATVSPSQLTFTPANFAAAQTVTVNGTNDADAVDDSTAAQVRATGLVTEQVQIRVEDDEIVAVATSTRTTAVREGTSRTFTVQLASPPAFATVEVHARSEDAAALTVMPTRLTFTPANFSVPRTITITAQQDANNRDESTRVRFGISGGEQTWVFVDVEDDD